MRKNTKTIHRLLLYVSLLSALGIQGCASTPPVPAGTVFSNGYRSYLSDAYCFSSYTNQDLKLLDYASMKTSSLCSQPNCKHTDPDCIVQRLDRKTPLISGGYAYYFLDNAAEFYENENGKTDVKLGSVLCFRDLRKGKEKKLLNVDGYSIASVYGWLLHDGLFYYVGNGLSRHYDENHNLLYCGNSGGEMSLCFANPSDSETAGLCTLYDTDAIAEYYPEAPNSAEAYMKGLFDNKIYFNIGFVERGDQWESGFSYRFYVTYYDLSDGSYHGTPEDYADIDFSAVNFLSDDYLVICREGEAAVYEKDTMQAVILKDSCFVPDVTAVSAFNGMVFCSGKVFDLNTGAVHESQTLKADSPDMNSKEVVAGYGNDYIVCDDALNFEKIPAEKLLS